MRSDEPDESTMQVLILAMLVVATTFDYLSHGDPFGRFTVLPGAASYTSEILSGVALAYVVLAGSRNRFRYVRAEYWLVFGVLVLMIALGVLANHVEAGAVFAGIRNYFRALPWFFVPAVFAFSDSQVQTQLRVLLVIAILQLPLAVEQTLTTTSRGFGFTGDFTGGTLMLSPTLSIFLVGALCIMSAMRMRRLLPLWKFVVLFVLLVFPTMINETKATFILLPLGLIFAYLAAARPDERLRAAVMSLGAAVVFLSVAVPIYDWMVKDRLYSTPIAEFVTNPARLERYLWKKQDIGTTKEVGRVDAIIVSVREATADPLRVVFGLGIGTVSDSALGRGFAGRHFDVLGPFAKPSATKIMLELGVVGLALVASLMWLVFQDARALARDRAGLMSALSAGWVGVIGVMAVSMIYVDVIAQTSLSYLFWYFAGLVAAHRMRCRLN